MDHIRNNFYISRSGFSIVFDVIFSIVLDLESLGINCLHLMRSKVRERSNAGFPVTARHVAIVAYFFLSLFSIDYWHVVISLHMFKVCKLNAKASCYVLKILYLGGVMNMLLT